MNSDNSKILSIFLCLLLFLDYEARYSKILKNIIITSCATPCFHIVTLAVLHLKISTYMQARQLLGKQINLSSFGPLQHTPFFCKLWSHSFGTTQQSPSSTQELAAIEVFRKQNKMIIRTYCRIFISDLLQQYELLYILYSDKF